MITDLSERIKPDEPDDATTAAEPVDSGLVALTAVAGYYQIATDPWQLKHELAISGRLANAEDLIRGANLIGLKARIITQATDDRLARLPLPAIIEMEAGHFMVLAAGADPGCPRLVDIVARTASDESVAEIAARSTGRILLLARRIGGAGHDPKTFSFSWFMPSLKRYRKPLSQVLIASFVLQIFSLITPLLFQVVIDKVLMHKGLSTLIVIVLALVLLGAFDALLQCLRGYVLNHTTNRIDVEVGRRLFYHLFRLPLAYFETRPAGQTVARIRELETIRSFLTGQGLTSILDLIFTVVLIGVLFLYSTKLALVVVVSIPLYVIIAIVLRPLLRDRINEKFNRGAASQQFLVESIIGAQTIKAAAVEPMIQVQWEERLAAYVRTSFDATVLSVIGQNAIQFVSKTTTALILFFGARAVIDGQLSVGELIAFNMIAAQAAQPVLRLSQLWQDFQQVQVSVERLGDILNTPAEARPRNLATLPSPRGGIEFRNVSFRYRPDLPDVLHNVNLSIRPGEVIGLVGASGCGKSTLTKLVQRLYMPQSGAIFLDGMDIAQIDPGWLRRQTGVVLQENMLFNRSIHENIALGNPAMPRALVMQVARLAGAHEFIGQMSQGYDTILEERGANLSGGQRQRIAIARALATNPRILILDEATSALDCESERIIQDNMRAIVCGRTVIVVAHRLAAVRRCDRVIALRDGEIVEEGTHESLMALKQGIYAGMWALQSDYALR
ncbi:MULTISPECIES: type I secretion system permease/ATPase [unclassified Beijerinckia]|uniref:type I secretion system permease/ATPase n=1 Tax=unclassified Beijerinckia TaxID=2638183 RepID=UPI0008992D1B|nr:MULTISPECIES: type I secretion system permease/ATPase [unclassified Beijerinckia]MDH7796984.1 subfamily B ATP-binding cassette protein HlyB/CyaB [Beijerinckia sp. GAS462]SEC67520.1 ATP-binding cassette, subfamily B, HlyB/CyaB [Beijerinckia sp. 28-YEA-48]